MPFGRRVTYYLRHVAAVVGVRAVRFRELLKAFCIGLLHRRAVKLELMSTLSQSGPEGSYSGSRTRWDCRPDRDFGPDLLSPGRLLAASSSAGVARRRQGKISPKASSRAGF